MKLLSISINGYKNLIDCRMQMGNFNVLTGINNIGKSNFLEIFLFLDTLLTAGEEPKIQLFNGFLDGANIMFRNLNLDDDTVKVEIELSTIIDDEEYKYWYCVEIKLTPIKKIKSKVTKALDLEEYYGIIKETFKYKNQKNTGRPIMVFEREGEEIKKMIGQRIKKIDASEPLLSLVNKVKDIKDSFNSEIQNGIAATFTVCKTPVLYSSPEFIRMGLKVNKIDNSIASSRKRVIALKLDEEIDKIMQSDKKQYFTEITKDLLGISRFDVIRFKEKFLFVSAECGNNSSCMLDQLSDGTLAVLNLLVYLLTNKYPIIAIEELENSVHPKLLRKIINLIKFSFTDNQFLITTHSPVMLNMVKAENIYIMSDYGGKVNIEQVVNKKQLIKKLSGPFASMEDIFFESEV